MVLHDFFATSPHGTEDLLMTELAALGAERIASVRSGASFRGSLSTAYRVCLWSRVASRVFFPLGQVPAASVDELYAGARTFPWEDHLRPDATLAVDCSLHRSALGHSRHAALKVKDAVVDRFRERCGRRPSVQLEYPDLRIAVLVEGDMATLSLDLSGESLFRRGYRESGGLAPLKENLAAAILLRAGWPAIAARGGALLDPLCGSGTLLIEGTLMAADIAPGLFRSRFGFETWPGHDAAVWRELLREAEERRAAGLVGLPVILGCDRDANIVAVAMHNLKKAGLGERVHVDTADFAAWLSEVRTQAGEGGLLVTNPPYGERLGDEARLRVLYAALGDLCRRHYSGWQLSVLTGNPELAGHLGLRATKAHSLRNGPIRARLFHYELRASDTPSAADQRPSAEESIRAEPRDAAAEMLANRLRKNLKTARRQARAEATECYRVYDADLPEYAVAIDLYGSRVHVQEYQAPPSIDAGKARRRLQDALRVIAEVLEVPVDAIFLKQRRRQRGAGQYARLAQAGSFFEVVEGPCRFWVNLGDYLDTGLFLDHRPIRREILSLAAGKRFLNLFGYTGAATVFAARGGAAASLTVDASRAYLDWAQRNLVLNGLAGPAHRQLRADVLSWLATSRETFDLIFLDPPTFSNSKDRDAILDVQRDHPALIRQAMKRLAPGGTLIFSTNFRRFRLDEGLSAEFSFEEITSRTIPWDFRRRPGIHRCWLIRAAQESLRVGHQEAARILVRSGKKQLKKS